MCECEYERDEEKENQAKNVQRTTATLTFDKIGWMNDEWMKEKKDADKTSMRHNQAFYSFTPIVCV